MRLDEIVPGFRSAALDEFAVRYGSDDLVGSPCWQLEKRPAITGSRQFSKRELTELFDRLVPLIRQIWVEILEFRKNPPKSGGDML